MSQTDYSTGELKRTGNDLDLAISGKGFFHVKGDDGAAVSSRGPATSRWIHKIGW